MLFQTPPLTEREAEVVNEIETIRRQLNLPRLREWTGLPWRAIHARVVQVPAATTGASAPLEHASAAAQADEPRSESQDAWADASGYHAALTFVLQLADAPDFVYDEGIFRALHYMIVGHDPEKGPGRWRRGSMFVLKYPSREAIYTAPHAKFVRALMAELIESLNARDDCPGYIRAAMAHLNLGTIHPFRDGNGRMSRALHTLVLAREGICAPPFASIDEYLGVNSIEYDKVLQEVHGGAWQPERDARPWIRFCLTAHFRQATTLLRKTREYDRLWEELEREVARRGLPEPVISALAEAAITGRLNSAQYRSAAGVSAHVANRDLKCLVAAGLLVATSDERGRCYLAAESVKAIRERTRDPDTLAPDPFAA